MRPRLFAMFFLLLPAAGLADSSKENEECQRMILAFSSELVREADELETKHDERLSKIIARFDFAPDDADPGGPGVRAAVESMIRYHDREQLRKRYIDSLRDNLLAAVTGTETGDCDSRIDYEWQVDNHLEAYDARLEFIRDEVDNRLDLEKMSDRDGLAIIAFYAYGKLDSVRINKLGSITGSFSFGPVENEQYFRVVRIPAGRYGWDRVTKEAFNGTYATDYRGSHLSFEVAPGKLNYTGVFIYTSLNWTYSTASLHDRTSIVLTILERRHPDLIDRYDIANGLIPEDRFIDYYLGEKRRHVATGAADE